MKVKKIAVTLSLIATLTSGCATLNTINPERCRNKPVLNTSSIPSISAQIVIILSGIGSRVERMGKIRNEFIKRSYYPININVPLSVYTPKELSDKVDEEINRLNLTDKKVYHVVYSVGGLPLFSYLYEHHPKLEKSAFVCSPLKGSHLADYYKKTKGGQWYYHHVGNLADALSTTGKAMYDITFAPVLASCRALLIGGIKNKDNGKIPGPDDGTIGLTECLVADYDTKVIMRGTHLQVIYSEKTFDTIDRYFSDSTPK